MATDSLAHFAAGLTGLSAKLDRHRSELLTKHTVRIEILNEILVLHRTSREIESNQLRQAVKSVEFPLEPALRELRELHRDLAGLSLSFQCAAYAQLPADQRQNLVSLALISIKAPMINDKVVAQHRRSLERVRSQAG